MATPLRIINASAPIRICDIGGWTDTWFAEQGAVLNIAVNPRVYAQLFVYNRAAVQDRITIYAENFDECIYFNASRPLLEGKHALLEAAFTAMTIPDELAIEVHLYAEVPPGASTGTSAAVSIALIAALDQLTSDRLSPMELAQMAHHIETDILGWQCGVQDQLASAFGGINYMQIHQYPFAAVSPVRLSEELWLELEHRLMLVYLGSSHVSSHVHQKVIRNFEQSGKDDPRLVGLREQARRAKNALQMADLGVFADAMKTNTAWQAQMHDEIVGDNVRTLIDIARETNVQGWKLNGAGGNGGSMTLLFGQVYHDKRRFIHAMAERLPAAHIIPITLSHEGVQVWESPVTDYPFENSDREAACQENSMS